MLLWICLLFCATASEHVYLNSFARYPGYEGSLVPRGKVAMLFKETRVYFEYFLNGVDGSCMHGPEAGTANSCGIHIHQGTSCTDASLVGGHFYNAALLSKDPWTYDAFYQPGDSAGLVVEYGYNTGTGHVFVLHDRKGVRISCDVIKPDSSNLQQQNENVDVYINAFSAYPGYTGHFTPTGKVELSFRDTHVYMAYFLEGMDKDCIHGPKAGTANSCGIHIHKGTSCADGSLVGGHLYNSDVLAEDPWIYDAFYEPTASAGLVVEYGYSSGLGHTFVLHDREGVRVSCDVIKLEQKLLWSPQLTGAGVVHLTQFSVYPGYTGPLAPKGRVEISFRHRRVYLVYSLEGVDPACEAGPKAGTANSCGIHIHKGTSCADGSLVGGHLYNSDVLDEDPWIYDAFYEPTASAGLVVEYGYSSGRGHAFVLHDREGVRISCDIIKGSSSLNKRRPRNSHVELFRLRGSLMP